MCDRCLEEACSERGRAGREGREAERENEGEQEEREEKQRENERETEKRPVDMIRYIDR